MNFALLISTPLLFYDSEIFTQPADAGDPSRIPRVQHRAFSDIVDIGDYPETERASPDLLG